MIDEDRLREVLAANVPRLRRQQRLSQQQLADAVGIHRVTLARIETRRVTPTADVLFALADELGVPADALRQVAEISAKSA